MLMLVLLYIDIICAVEVAVLLRRWMLKSKVLWFHCSWREGLRAFGCRLLGRPLE